MSAAALLPVAAAAAVLLAGLGAAGPGRPRALGLLGAAAVPVSLRSGVEEIFAAAGRPPVLSRLARSPRLRRRLDLAGAGWTVESAIGRKVLAGAGAGLLVMALFPGGAAFLTVPVAAAAGFHLPDLILARLARRRQGAIERAVPNLVELLVATSEAGLAPAVALRRAGEVLTGPLAAEVGRAVEEIDLGVPWRAALEHVVDRTEVPSLRRLTGALARSRRLGSAIRPVLREVARELREERRAAAEEAARRAPVKMLFPLVLLVLPAFLLLTVGPVVLATIRSLQTGG